MADFRETRVEVAATFSLGNCLRAILNPKIFWGQRHPYRGPRGPLRGPPRGFLPKKPFPPARTLKILIY